MLNMEHILVARLPLSSAKYAMDTLRWGTLGVVRLYSLL
jgi:hypothetical protein